MPEQHTLQWNLNILFIPIEHPPAIHIPMCIAAEIILLDESSSQFDPGMLLNLKDVKLLMVCGGIDKVGGHVAVAVEISSQICLPLVQRRYEV
jgi:hypothetical protein